MIQWPLGHRGFILAIRINFDIRQFWQDHNICEVVRCILSLVTNAENATYDEWPRTCIESKGIWKNG
jgi:hypothetical protein